LRTFKGAVSSRHDFEDFGICAQIAMKIRTQETRGNSQLLQSANPHMRKILS
jgi:hypothetical protein